MHKQRQMLSFNFIQEKTLEKGKGKKNGIQSKLMYIYSAENCICVKIKLLDSGMLKRK